MKKNLTCGIVCLYLAILTGCSTKTPVTQPPVALTASPETEKPAATATITAAASTMGASPTSTPHLDTATSTATSVPATASPTYEPEAAANSADDIIGTWRTKYIDIPILIIYYDDGTYGVKWPDSNIWIARGKYQLKDGQLVLEDSKSGDACLTGSWKVYVTRQAGVPVRLRYELIADACEDRVKMLKNKTHALVPSS
jgi:predicted small lipoprotein YifL